VGRGWVVGWSVSRLHDLTSGKPNSLTQTNKPTPGRRAEPSQASLTCAVAPGAFVPDPKKLEGTEGREVFSEKKGISIFKVRPAPASRVPLPHPADHPQHPPFPPPPHPPSTHPTPPPRQDKTLRIRRLYDPDRRTLLYVAYSTRLSTAADEGGVSTGRYRTSICALHLPDAPAVGGAAAELPSAPVAAE
jgi:hypothetical protein